MSWKTLEVRKMQSRTATAKITESAILVAAALILSFFKLELWANGGSINLAMIPIIVLAIRRGTLWGMGGGLVLGTLKCIISGGIAWGWASILLDYSVAFMAVGLAGLGRNHGVVLPTVIGCVGRFIVLYISGDTINAVSVSAPGEIFGGSFSNAALYSLIYNGSYMLVNMLLAIVILLLLKKPLGKYLKPVK